MQKQPRRIAGYYLHVFVSCIIEIAPLVMIECSCFQTAPFTLPGHVVVSDPDGSNVFMYALVDSPQSAYFSIHSTSGAITLIKQLDYDDDVVFPGGMVLLGMFETRAASVSYISVFDHTQDHCSVTYSSGGCLHMKRRYG